MDGASGLIAAVGHVCEAEYVTLGSVSLFRRGRDGRGGVLQPRAHTKGSAGAVYYFR